VSISSGSSSNWKISSLVDMRFSKAQGVALLHKISHSNLTPILFMLFGNGQYVFVRNHIGQASTTQRRKGLHRNIVRVTIVHNLSPLEVHRYFYFLIYQGGNFGSILRNQILQRMLTITLETLIATTKPFSFGILVEDVPSGHTSSLRVPISRRVVTSRTMKQDEMVIQVS
jgi:hypothetical protein